MTVTKGQYVDAHIDGVDLRFYVVDPMDTVQKHHFRGEFYEKEELSIIARHFPKGGVFVDVGGNVGNHTIYVSKLLCAAHVVVIEPNPEALDILRINLQLNGLDADKVQLFPVGLSNGEGFARAQPRYRHNLGATQIIQLSPEEAKETNQVLTLVSGDKLLEGRLVDFIKIDVEGSALDVLDGLRKTISVRRPAIFIELEDEVLPKFETWLAENNYVIVDQFVRYKGQVNYMVLAR